MVLIEKRSWVSFIWLLTCMLAAWNTSPTPAFQPTATPVTTIATTIRMSLRMAI
ncbi:hypothetical protein D3C87_1975830 [compost metagenome]